MYQYIAGDRQTCVRPASDLTQFASDCTVDMMQDTKRACDKKGLCYMGSAVQRNATVVTHTNMSHCQRRKHSWPHEFVYAQDEPHRVNKRAADMKQAGNAAFEQGRFADALANYQLAVQEEAGDKAETAKLYSNLSATSAKLGRYAAAATEAAQVIQLQPSWHKGYLRHSHALICLRQYTEAAETIKQGLSRAKDTARLLDAQEALQDLAKKLQHSKKPNRHVVQQSGSSLQAALGKLQAAGIGAALPITVLSGFLGAGKTTLLNRILSTEQNLKMAVIVNDMAEVNVDAELVRGQAAGHEVQLVQEQLVELSNGCICCTLRDDLLKEVAEMASAGRFDYLVIESTGISEPLPVAATFYTPDASGTSMEGFARIDTMVTVVDASNVLASLESCDLLLDRQLASTDTDRRSIVTLLIDQIEFADVLVLNKTDLVPQRELEKIAMLLHRLNPAANVLPVVRCEIPIHSILNTKRFDLDTASLAAGWKQELLGGVHAPESLEYGITSFVYRATEAFHPQRLWTQALEQKELLNSVLRSKGFFWIASHPQLVWEWSTAGASRSFNVYGQFKQSTIEAQTSKPEQKIVFIGIGLDEPSIRCVLDTCLLTDDEALLQPHVWGHWALLWDSL